MSNQKLIIGYYRLSMEDDSEGESNSIINQRKLVKDYISNIPEYPFQDDFFSVGICSKAGAVSVRRFFVRFCIRSKDIHSFSDSENNRRAASVNFWQSADKPFPASDIFRTFGSDKPILLWR